MTQTFVEVSVEVDGKKEAVLISEETYEILRDGAFLRNRRMEWFLFKTVKKYGSLTEENILRLMDEEWVF